MATNPILDEINGLSPGAKAALTQAHQTVMGSQQPTITPEQKQASIAGAQPPPQMPTMQAPSATPPQMGAPALPNVQAPRGTVQGDTANVARMEAQKPFLENIYHDISQSRFGQAHPLAGKFLGGLAQIPATIADIGLSRAVPGIGAFVPGTTQHKGMQVGAAQKELAQETKNEQEQALTGEENARTGLIGEQTAELPGNDAARRALEDAQVQNYLHPQAKTAFQDWRQQNPTAPTADFFKAEAEARPTKEARPDTPEQQYIDEYQRTHQGSSIAEALKHYKADTESPQRPPQVMVMVPNAQGGSTAEVLRPGQQVAPGTMTAQQFGAGNEADAKAQKAAEKAQKDARSEYQLMTRLASNPSPTNDFAMVMHYIGATKPESLGKLRLNQNEIALVLGTRSSFGDLEALGEKIRNGQKLTPTQRNDMLGTMRILSGAPETREYQGHTYEKGDDGQWHLQKPNSNQ